MKLILLWLPITIFAEFNAMNIAFREDFLQNIYTHALESWPNYIINTDLEDIIIQTEDPNYPTAKFSNIILTDISLNYSSPITIKESDVIELSINDVNAFFDSNLTLQGGETPLENPCKLEINETDITIYIFIFMGNDGEAVVGVKNSLANIGNISLMNTLNETINEAIWKGLQKEIAIFEKEIIGLFEKYVIEWNHYLSQRPYKTPLKDLGIVVDTHLAHNATTTNNYLSLPLIGTVLNAKTGLPILNYTSSTLPSSSQRQFPIQLFLSDYFVNSALIQWWINLSVDLLTLPPNFPFKLTTNGLAFFVPQLQLTYGKNKPVYIQFTADPENPIPSFTTNNAVYFQGYIQMIFWVQIQKSWVRAFNMQVLTNAVFPLSIVNTTATYKINSLQASKISVTDSNVGTINTLLTANVLNNVFQILIPFINLQYDQMNVKIPDLEHYKIQGDIVNVYKGYTEIDYFLIPIIQNKF
ncbi:unnamed protein product [Blepharisma stoltei]|uniref:Lipid-binding serum glycoprotein C-terminal domain-containing protein n=1 Tax=Blepharisma stoltei TaxID=1481888 RepID=A0AAU9K512_9CILI|nr:unnamed protein product [Blepharisma stoltei]